MIKYISLFLLGFIVGKVEKSIRGSYKYILLGIGTVALLIGILNIPEYRDPKVGDEDLTEWEGKEVSIAGFWSANTTTDEGINYIVKHPYQTDVVSSPAIAMKLSSDLDVEASKFPQVFKGTIKDNQLVLESTEDYEPHHTKEVSAHQYYHLEQNNFIGLVDSSFSTVYEYLNSEKKPKEKLSLDYIDLLLDLVPEEYEEPRKIVLSIKLLVQEINEAKFSKFETLNDEAQHLYNDFYDWLAGVTVEGYNLK